MKNIAFCFGVFFSLIFSTSFSQDGSVDQSFGIGGVVETDFYGYNDKSFSVAQQNNGKIISAGIIEVEYDNYMASLVRYHIDGTLDTAFGDNGVVLYELGGGYNAFVSISTLINDDIIAAGTQGAGEEKDFLIHKFLASGDVDNDFGVNGVITTDFFNDYDTLSKIIVQEDEKILAIGGSVQESDYIISLARYLPTGELDTTFGVNGKLALDINNDYPRSITASLQNDNSIIVSFIEDINTNIEAVIIVKLFENGVLDTSFGIDGIVELQYNDVIDIRSALEVDFNNNILVVVTNTINFDEYSTTIFRYIENGVLDASFGVNGSFNFDIPFFTRKIIIQPNSRILIGGGVPEFEGSAFILKRLFNNGSIDNSLVEFDYSYFESSDMLLQNDGKIVATANTYWYDGPRDFVLARYNNTPLSVSEFNLKNVSIYPNPSKDLFTIKFDALEAEINYYVSDVVGKIILSGKMDALQTKVDLSKMQIGMYFLNIEGNSYRLLKE